MNLAAFTIDGRQVDRDAFYAVACDPARSVVVEACAGAGKTWMLVSRILRALLDGTQPQEILAITFTRKAAGEMRQRLDDWLREFADPACDDGRRIDELRARGLGEAQARALAPALASLHATVLQAGRSVEVRTFHAWFAQLLRVAPLELLEEVGLPRDATLIEDMRDHAAAVHRAFHAVVADDAALAADYERVVLDHGRSQLRAWLDVALDRRIEIELADAAGTLEPSVAPAAVRWPELGRYAHPAEHLRSAAVLAQLAATATALGRQSHGTARQRGALLERALSLTDPLACLFAVRDALLTQKNELRANVDAPGLAETAALVLFIANASAQQEAHLEHLRMVRLSRALLRTYARYKRSRGLADMNDLESAALALLRDSSLSGWVQERLDARIRHVLIDEFQDTSPLQWHALASWLSGYAGAGGGPHAPVVFIVGDPKQSIYRFRRAEPRVFVAAMDVVRRIFGGQVLACDHTRRNAPGVISALNAVFAQAQDDGDFAGFRPHTTQVADVDAVAVRLLPRVERPPAATLAAASATWRDTLTTPRHEPEEVLRQREADLVARAVRQTVASGAARPGDIQVLCRKRETLRLVADALAALHLPFAAPEDSALMDAPEVRDLVAVLDVLASRRHRLSLAHALRSPVFGAGDDDLALLARAAGPHRDWWSALMAVDDDGPAALVRARRLFVDWRRLARSLSPHDLIDAIVAQGDVVARYAAAVPPERRLAALGAIDALLLQALVIDGARYATPYNLVRSLKRRRIKTTAPLAPEAVQLLTVHGAKGLEADVVFVVDADPEPKRSETVTLLTDWPAEAAHPTVCAFVYSETRLPPSLATLMAAETLAREREELNGLYVAMSRARRQLVFSATQPYLAPARSSWWMRVQRLGVHWEPEGASGESGPPVASTVRVRELPAWAGRSVPDAPAVGLEATGNDPASRLGQAVHRVLEWAGRPGAPAPDIAALATAAAAEFQTDPAAVTRAAGAIWHSPACARFFRGPALHWAGNEVPVAEGGEVLRIDRLVELRSGGVAQWWVLDYKLGARPNDVADHRMQIARYRRALATLLPGVSIRCAFITGRGELVESD